MIRRLVRTGPFESAARLVLAVMVLFAMSAPLAHVHATHASPAGGQLESGAHAAHAGHQHSHQNEPAAPDHPAGGLDCCLHHSSPISPQVGAPMLARYDAVSGRIAIPDDLVLDAAAASRLERPPRQLHST
ncbi:MAG: hypothetical protein JNK84_16770 [Phreatobacter sp.]|uniref:hypothetical protein n=1 Tax=Phreatobacter sp. TaxID=1966341 RepID=UPI001A4C72D5|nr:hypothetical protein [Phreatobacter sp.]MBL8570725.1 hypothetical protein [Phreatobacter sp.]